jgi:hypothetical protein
MERGEKMQGNRARGREKMWKKRGSERGWERVRESRGKERKGLEEVVPIFGDGECSSPV